MSEAFLSKAGEEFCESEADELLYGAVEVDEVARVAFELESQRERAYRITFPVALWRLGACSFSPPPRHVVLIPRCLFRLRRTLH